MTASLTPVQRSTVPFGANELNDAKALEAEIKQDAELKAALKKLQETAGRPKAAKAMPQQPLAKPEEPPLPPLTQMARRERKKVVQGGHTGVDARIDLHGLTQAQAHDRLIDFLFHSQSRNHAVVLIITGKGTQGYGEERGVLRRMVPHWLSSPELRPYVIGFEQAHLRHGGEGALYVRIRRRRGTTGLY